MFSSAMLVQPGTISKEFFFLLPIPFHPFFFWKGTSLCGLGWFLFSETNLFVVLCFLSLLMKNVLRHTVAKKKGTSLSIHIWSCYLLQYPSWMKTWSNVWIYYLFVMVWVDRPLYFVPLVYWWLLIHVFILDISISYYPNFAYLKLWMITRVPF